MKYDELQVKSNEKDIHIKSLKDQLNEAEYKTMSLEKVCVPVCCMCSKYVCSGSLTAMHCFKI